MNSEQLYNVSNLTSATSSVCQRHWSLF